MNSKPEKSLLKKFIIYHFPAILFAILIISVSSIPNLSVRKLRFLAFDKVVHFLEYAFFALLVFRSISNISPKVSLNQAVTFSAVGVIFFSLADEFYQRYIPGRHFDYYDILTDVLGALLVLLLLWINRKRLKQTTT